jgi:hypothetical protein
MAGRRRALALRCHSDSGIHFSPQGARRRSFRFGLHFTTDGSFFVLLLLWCTLEN